MIFLFPNTAVTSVLTMGFRVHPVLLYYVLTGLIMSDVESLPQSNLYSLQTLSRLWPRPLFQDGFHSVLADSFPSTGPVCTWIFNIKIFWGHYRYKSISLGTSPREHWHKYSSLKSGVTQNAHLISVNKMLFLYRS